MSGGSFLRVSMPSLVVSLTLAEIILGVAFSARHLAEHGAFSGPVYTVAAVRDGLAGQRAAWEGRAVVLRARAEPCPWWGGGERAQHCAGMPLVLVDLGGAPPGEPLPLEQLTPRSWSAFVRGLPLIGPLLPRPRAIPFYAPARFRVQLHVLPAHSCGHLPCYAARVLDLLPGAQ